MWDRLRHVWLPRICYLSAIAIASSLFAVVILAPWMTAYDMPLLALFAGNAGVRGAAIASAVGLLVTARVFFRASRPEKRSRREPPSGNMAGA